MLLWRATRSGKPITRGLTFRVIDTHCHIDFDEFAADRDAVLRRALAAGVTRLIIPSIHPDHWTRAQQHIEVCAAGGITAYCAIGLHPWWADSYPLADLPSALQSALPGAVAVGECGLDALRNIDMALQVAVLRCHIDAAKQHRLPLILHCVKAHEEMLSLLKEMGPEAGGVVHGFGGSLEIAREYLRLGFKIGVGGMVTRPHATRAQRAFKALPLHGLVLETDAPAMPIWDHVNEQLEGRNEPANVARIARALAELRGCPLKSMLAEIEQSTLATFTQMG
jgi:TatD DNase family protein